MADEILFGKGEENPFGEFFIGQSYLKLLAQEGEVMVANVTITGTYTMQMKTEVKYCW